MNSRWVHAIMSLVMLVGTYVAYARCIVPIVEPPHDTSRNRPSLAVQHFQAPAARYAKLLESLFPENSWERRNDAMIIRTDEMLLVLRNPTTTQDGRLHLKPCTLVYLPSSDKPAARTWTLRTQGGAVLEFDGPFNLHGTGMGKLQSGFLPGQVTIVGETRTGDVTFSPSNTASADRVEIETRGVQLTKERLTAPYQVHFRYGPSFGSGRGLSIDFQAAADGDNEAASRLKTAGKPPFEISRIELVSLEQVVFFPPHKDSSNVRPDPILPFRIQSEGPLVIDLESGMATISKDVLIERAHTTNAPDRLQCNRLTAHLMRLPDAALSPPSPTSVARANPSRVSAAMPKMELERIVAEGLPAIATWSTGNGANARWHRFEAERLEYTFDVHQDNGLVGFGNGSRHSRNLRNAATPPTNSSSLSIWPSTGFRAAGTGRYLTGVPTERVTQMELRWRDRLDIDTSSPDSIGMTLSGDTACRIKELGEIFADKVWIGIRNEPDLTARTSRSTARFGQLRPEKIVAQQQVRIRTNQLDAYTERLDVVIEDSTGQFSGPNHPGRTSDQTQDAPTNAPFGPSAYEDIGATNRKFAIEGERLLVKVLRAGENHQLDEVLLQGRVRCVESSSDDTRSPVEMTGSQLRLTEFTETGGVASIRGEPAIVRAREMAISGKNIHVDREQNRIWIDGHGAATVPLPAHIADRFPNRPAVADIRWEGGLEFDGQWIQCNQRVLIQGPAQRIRAERLAAQLVHRIDLTAARLEPQDVALQSLVAENQVDIENRTMDASGWLSIERGIVNRIELDYPSQVITGTGPGWIETVRRGTAIRAMNPAATTNSEPADSDNDSLMYLRVAFGNGFQGDMTRRNLSFENQIRAVFGPVARWDSRLELHDGELLPEVARLTCEKLTIFQIPGREGNPFELSATGNTLIEGKTTNGQMFAARAHRLSFDPAKDLLMLQGDSRSEAQLFYQRRPGAARSTLGPARQIKFWPKTNRYKLDGVGMIDFQDLGG